MILVAAESANEICVVASKIDNAKSRSFILVRLPERQFSQIAAPEAADN